MGPESGLYKAFDTFQLPFQNALLNFLNIFIFNITSQISGGLRNFFREKQISYFCRFFFIILFFFIPFSLRLEGLDSKLEYATNRLPRGRHSRLSYVYTALWGPLLDPMLTTEHINLRI